jgi:hypothetical protein
VQFKIITTNSIFRVANVCQNIDIFWVLRGGSSRIFDIVMEATYRVKPAISLSVAFIKYNQTGSNIQEWLELLVDNGFG